MTRRTGDSHAFNQNDTGRMAFRHEWEAPDERPLLVYTDQLWEDETERMTYEDATEADRPKPEDTLLSYLGRISATVRGKYKGVLPKMRRPGMSRQERTRQLEKLRGQLPGRTEVIE
jgi:hypothetical protein